MVEEFRVGVITATHGLRGEVKVFPTTDEPRRFSRLKTVRVDLDGGKKTLTIRSVKYFKNMVILAFEGLDTIEAVQHLRGKDLMISREDALPLKEGQYYIPDLIGLRVEEDGRVVGHVKDVMQTGANDVYVVETAEGKELLLPAIPDCILDVDTQGGVMQVNVLDGLEDL
ncbi:MAG: 16S rRNA processing protein RimM [Lachnospiraceae bacterium]|nr:16S rRNA processing protein RimM [Lachnospiraceae bacterium]